MMTQVDEIDNDKHMNMTFTEFLEALVRVAENLAIPHLMEDGYAYDQLVNDLMTEEDKLRFA